MKTLAEGLRSSTPSLISRKYQSSSFPPRLLDRHDRPVLGDSRRGRLLDRLLDPDRAIGLHRALVDEGRARVDRGPDVPLHHQATERPAAPRKTAAESPTRLPPAIGPERRSSRAERKIEPRDRHALLDAPVLIVGGSLVGLSAAVFLGPRGVRVAGRRASPRDRDPPARGARQPAHDGDLPRGRDRGAIEEAAAREFVQNGAIVSVESLGGKELDWYFREINEGVEDLSPRRGSSSPRSAWSRSCSARPARAGAEVAVRIGGRRRLEQDGDGVTAAIRPRDGGDERTVRAQYLVAADGAHSPTRERLGIEHARPRQLLGQHHDLLPCRHPRVARRPEPERDLRLPSAARRLLPLLDRRRRRLPRRQRDDRRGRATARPRSART